MILGCIGDAGTTLMTFVAFVVNLSGMNHQSVDAAMLVHLITVAMTMKKPDTYGYILDDF